MERQKLRWGILGLGKIANKFAQDLSIVENCELVAVASSSKSRAITFSAAHGAKKYFTDYELLVKDDKIDIVYVATPHSFHIEHALLAIQNGKHVLCEKPLAINRIQVERLVDEARKHNVFLMEALWTRFHPTIEAVLNHIEKGEIGTVNYIHSDFSFYSEAPDSSRLFNMNLAGGALLDIGIYPIFLAYLLKGYPDDILSTAILHTTGADLQTSVILKYKDGMSNLMCGFRSDSDMVAKIYGSTGRIYIDGRWHESDGYKVDKNGESKSYTSPKQGLGLTHEIEECYRCISEGRIESEKWSHQNSLELISILDEVRKQIGLQYPGEVW